MYSVSREQIEIYLFKLTYNLLINVVNEKASDAIKELLKKIEGTEIEKLLVKHHVI